VRLGSRIYHIQAELQNDIGVTRLRADLGGHAAARWIGEQGNLSLADLELKPALMICDRLSAWLAWPFNETRALATDRSFSSSTRPANTRSACLSAIGGASTR